MKPTANKTIRCKSDCMIIFYDHKEAPIKMMYEENGLQNLQLYGNKLDGKTYQTRRSVLFNEIQNKMYRRVIFGTDALNKKELSGMNEADLEQVRQTQRDAQRVLNAYKNQVMSSYIDKFFSEVFWNSPIAKEMVQFSKDSESIHDDNTLSFKELGITKKQIACKLIETGFLPVNFFYISK